MKRPGFLLLLLLVSPMALPAQWKLPYAMAASPEIPIRVWVPAGSVRIETWDRDSLRLTGTIGKGVHLFGGGGASGAKLGVENDRASDTTIARGDLILTVPRHARVAVKMTDGTVEASGTAGEFEVITVAGQVTVRDASGVVTVETIDAAVSLTRIQGAVRVQSGGGKVSLEQVSASLTVSTVSADVALTGAALHDTRIQTIGGGITMRGNVGADATLDLETHSGAILITLDPAHSPVLSLTSRGGVVKNLLGKVVGNQGQLVAHSFKGDITVLPVIIAPLKKGGQPP